MKVAESGNTGIYVHGDKSVIRDNRVLTTGGGPAFGASGIFLSRSDDGVVSGNNVSGISESGMNIGIWIPGSNRVKIIGNEISGINGGSSDIAIFLDNTDDVIVAQNRLLNTAGTGTGGIVDFANSDNVVCRDNEADGFSATPYSGCDFSNGNRQSFN